MKFTLKKSDLNLRVYTTPSKPTAAGAENDIAIISSVPMGNWLMSPEKPSGMPRNDGDVWIQYSTDGNTFNALKQNALMIATISAWQYVDGAWVDREAVSCQGGKWAEWISYFYKEGNQYTDITGGWTSDGLTWGSSAIGYKAIFNGDSIGLNSSTSATGGVATKNNISLRNITKLYMRYTLTGSSQTQTRFGVTLSNEIAYGYGSYNMPASMQIPTAQNSIIDVDVSSVDEGRIFATCNTGGGTLTIYEVWGE